MKNISTFIFDVDGVLTDGTITVTDDGEMNRTMHTKDGYALREALKQGFKICIITGGTSIGVKKRLEGLGISEVYLGIHNKMESFNEFIKNYEVEPKNILYMGDDIPDLKVMQQVALPCCPADAVSNIQSISAYISNYKGGKGCVRDVIEQVLRVQGKWVESTSARYD